MNLVRRMKKMAINRAGFNIERVCKHCGTNYSRPVKTKRGGWKDTWVISKGREGLDSSGFLCRSCFVVYKRGWRLYKDIEFLATNTRNEIIVTNVVIS